MKWVHQPDLFDQEPYQELTTFWTPFLYIPAVNGMAFSVILYADGNLVSFKHFLSTLFWILYKFMCHTVSAFCILYPLCYVMPVNE